ncbi:ABC transporter permease [Agrococcus versicolor]|uniref:ABC transporter permease n=1 Tax=Agrococcus versicolor TaxID=501482 RepID=A0ABP5MA46_9MICO
MTDQALLTTTSDATAAALLAGRASEGRRTRPRALDRAGVRAALGAAIPLALLVVWWALTIPGAAIVPPFRFASPLAVWEAGVDLAERGELGRFAAISLQRVLIGFVAGAALGLVVGGVVGLSRLAESLLAPILGVVRAVPSLAWVPLLIVWFQIGEQSKVILVAIGAFFPVFTTVSLALQHVDRHLVEVAHAFGRRTLGTFASVQLPSVLPALFTGLRLALVQAWLFLVAAELLGASMGLGFLLSRGQSNGRVDHILLAIVLLAVLGKLTDSVLAVVQRWAARRWS